MTRMSKFEKKFGKYAIKNLPLYIIIGYIIGYVIYFMGQFMFEDPYFILEYMSLSPERILQGQVWRLLTWIIVPPSGLSIFTIIMLYFYYSIGKALEGVWGEYRFNLYFFSGVLFTIVGSFILLILFQIGIVNSPNTWFSTYYINMSIILAFAATFPNNQILLMMFLPIKMKWLGIVYGSLLGYEFIVGSTGDKVVILASLLNFIIFYFQIRKKGRVSRTHKKRQTEFKRQTRPNVASGPRHKCAVCGRTELDGEDLVFRYCSKCDGNYEYCQDHLFTHEHVKK